MAAPTWPVGRKPPKFPVPETGGLSGLTLPLAGAWRVDVPDTVGIGTRHIGADRSLTQALSRVTFVADLFRAADLNDNSRVRLAKRCADTGDGREHNAPMSRGATAKSCPADRPFGAQTGHAEMRLGGLQGADSVSARHSPLKPLPDPIPLKKM